jgi:hypothetical protein
VFTPAERRAIAMAAGVTALGPAILVNGCLRAVDDEDAEDANEFILEHARSARSLTLDPAPEGISTFRVVGLVPDLRRHAGHDVEVIGTVVEETPVVSSATLEAKSITTRAERCGQQASASAPAEAR